MPSFNSILRASASLGNDLGTLGDKIICDLDKTTNFSQRSPQNCPKCGNPVKGHYCQGCAVLRQTFKGDLFASGVKHGIIQDFFEPSNDNSNVANAPREPFVVNQDPGKNSSQSPPRISNHRCYGCGDPLEVPIILDPEPFHNQTIKELPPTMQSFDPKPDLVHKSPNVSNPPPKLPFISCEFCRNDARYGHYCTPQVSFVYPKQCYNQDFNFLQEFQVFHDFQQQDLFCENGRVTHEAYQCQPKNKDHYHEQNSCYDSNSFGFDQFQPQQYTVNHPDESIKSSVENLVPIPSESEGESECDVPAREEFTTFLNVLFDADYEFDSSDVQSFFDKDALEEIFSNPLFEEEIIPMKIDQHHYNVESDLMESLRAHDSSLIISSKIDSLLNKFVNELALLKLIPPGIDDTDCDPEEDIRLIEKLLYDNSSPRPPEEFVFANFDTETESFSPSPIPVEDSDSLMKEIDLTFTPDYPMPSGIKDDDYDSERDILILKDLTSNDTLLIPEKESFHFDILSFSRPPTKPPVGNTLILNVKMMGDISDQKVPMHKLMITLVPHQEKSPNLLSYRGLKTFQPSAKCPMMIHGKNIPILDVPLFHFYPP
nr:hypothetical protein [Tanacetum cinerariifolium]